MNDKLEERELGWVKSHRQQMSSKIWSSSEGFQIWQWCLLKAHHSKIPSHYNIKTGKGETVVTIHQGQFIFGRNKAAKELPIDGNKIYRWITKMASKEYNYMISVHATNYFSIITVNNWSKYQGSDLTTNEQQMNNKCATNEQQMNTYKNVDNENNVKNGDKPEDLEVLSLYNENIENTKVAIAPPIQDMDLTDPVNRLIAGLPILDNEEIKEYGKSINYSDLSYREQAIVKENYIRGFIDKDMFFNDEDKQILNKLKDAYEKKNNIKRS